MTAVRIGVRPGLQEKALAQPEFDASHLERCRIALDQLFADIYRRLGYSRGLTT